MRFEAAFVLLVLALLGLEAWVVLRVRRVQPPPPPPPPPPLVTHCLLSYPRSGNHWMRYILEALTDRPTVGCGHREFDDDGYRQPALDGKLQLVISRRDCSPLREPIVGSESRRRKAACEQR